MVIKCQKKLEQVAKLKKTYIHGTYLVPVLQIIQKIPENYCPCLYLSIGHELWFKRSIQKCTIPNHQHVVVIDLVNHGMVKNTKTWISWEQNITFLWNKKIINLCLSIWDAICCRGKRVAKFEIQHDKINACLLLTAFLFLKFGSYLVIVKFIVIFN